VIEQEVNPILISLAAGATFVARGFAGDIPHLTDLIVQGISHQGISHIDVFQPCVTWRKDLPYEAYQKKIYKLESEGHDTSNYHAAVARAHETDRWPIGVFYNVSRPTYTDEIPFIKDKPLVKHDVDNVDISKYLQEFM
jgi:2-oxoglutarate ferredoxin oxidoreductase subunit beta